ncbi:hypothetical protein D4Z78_16505 [Okeania hirsuta]|nr:hypothetical protein D4Z78_16505 [Okeania hirsuta]
MQKTKEWAKKAVEAESIQQLIINNYLSLKRRGLTQRKIFSCFSFKAEALNLNYSVKLVPISTM